MGWVWKDDDHDDNSDDSQAISEFRSSSNVDYHSTRKVVQSNCRTEEVEPGKFVRKCEKTEQILRDCLGKPTEVVQSIKEYTEDDVTNEVMRSGSSITGPSDVHPFEFPGLRNDISSIERSLFGGINSFLDAADEMKNFFRVFDDLSLFGSEPSSPARSHGIPIEDHIDKKPAPKRNDYGSAGLDLSGLARDV